MSGEAAYVVFVLQSLKGEWEKYRNLKVWASREVKQLQNGLDDLEAFLKDADNITEKSNYFKQKESKIRDLVYDIQDTIEMYMTEMAVAKNKNIFSRVWASISTDKEEKVKDIRENRVQPILTDIENTFGKPQFNNIGSSSRLEKQLPEVEIKKSEGQRTSQKDQKQRKIVDFQEEEKILNYLFESKETLDVIAITGMAGLGKTTFARKIYDHKNVVAQFPLRIWITVSENFNSTDTFREIWKSILTFKKQIETLTDEKLIKLVRRFLESEKKFLLVVDDVWTEKDWREIKKILPEKKKKGNGKVLVTTRQIEVAEACSNFRLPYTMKNLESTKSLELLKYQVFDELDQFNEELEDIGNVIAEKCRGVPLVILVIGGILKKLYFEDDRAIPATAKKWDEVSKKLDENIGKDDKKLILDAVELSYKRLSHDLRLCFLYTGLFPENHEIPASTLTQLWIAEGFVAWKEELSAEENADQILKTLIKMNLVIVGKKNVEQVKTCWVHDMMRVFCRKKAEEENLFTVIKISNKVPPSPNAAVGFRRLCFDADPSGFLKNDLECVRSFLCFSEESVIESGAIEITTVTAVSKLLRVLNCRSIRFKQFPEVKRLMLLKHVTLFIENLKYLPEEVSQLINLQTLIVGTNSNFITVKANIWKMVRLKRLKTKVAIFLGDKNWKGEYSGNLQTITRLSPESCKTSLCKRAPHLKTLGVRGKLANVEKTKTMLLGDFRILENLKLENDESNPMPMVFTKLDWFPPNLKSLTLIHTFLQWDIHMPLLAKIEKLEVLKLKENAFNEENWEANVGAAFPKLEFLLMENLKLTTWKASDNDFPIIMSLVIKKCVLLKEIPESLAKHLSSLEIEGLLSSAVDAAKKIAQKQIKRNQEGRPECEVAFKLTIDQVPFSVTTDANSAASSSGQGN